MKKQYILFDLDGTLTDPGLGITKSAQHALEALGIIAENPEDLTFFVGPPLKDTFRDYYGMSDEDCDRAVEAFREYFVPTGMFENEIYPGIKDMLETLQNSGKSLMVATSKPTDFAEKILEHFEIDQYFDFVAGSTLEEERTKKSDVIAYLMEECQLVDTSELVMVGDRRYDIEAAKEFDIDTIGVLYGYGSKKELKKAGAGRIVKTVAELEEALLEEED